MPDIEYTTNDLRRGGGRAADGSESAAASGARLRGADPASPYGDVPGSSILHASVQRAQEHHLRMTAAAADALSQTSDRAVRTAVLGDAATAETTRLAARGEFAAAISGAM